MTGRVHGPRGCGGGTSPGLRRHRDLRSRGPPGRSPATGPRLGGASTGTGRPRLGVRRDKPTRGKGGGLFYVTGASGPSCFCCFFRRRAAASSDTAANVGVLRRIRSPLPSGPSVLSTCGTAWVPSPWDARATPSSPRPGRASPDAWRGTCRPSTWGGHRTPTGGSGPCREARGGGTRSPGPVPYTSGVAVSSWRSTGNRRTKGAGAQVCASGTHGTAPRAAAGGRSLRLPAGSPRVPGRLRARDPCRGLRRRLWRGGPSHADDRGASSSFAGAAAAGAPFWAASARSTPSRGPCGLRRDADGRSDLTPTPTPTRALEGTVGGRWGAEGRAGRGPSGVGGLYRWGWQGPGGGGSWGKDQGEPTPHSGRGAARSSATLGGGSSRRGGPRGRLPSVRGVPLEPCSADRQIKRSGP